VVALIEAYLQFHTANLNNQTNTPDHNSLAISGILILVALACVIALKLISLPNIFKGLLNVFAQPQPNLEQDGSITTGTGLKIILAYVSLLPLLFSTIWITSVFTAPRFDGLSIGLTALYALFVMPIFIAVSYSLAYAASKHLASKYKFSRLMMHLIILLNCTLFVYAIICAAAGYIHNAGFP
jgi:hypothetical protein